MSWLNAFKFNRVVAVLIYSDFLSISASGFLSPIIAIFWTNQIRGGSLAVVGFTTTIFWVVKSILQVPLSAYVDKKGSDIVTFVMLVAGSLLASVIPLLYYFFATDVWHVYLFEGLNGAANALMVPTWLVLFSKYLDKRREATEWAAHSNAVGVGYAAAAAAGGVLAQRYGFHFIFPLVSVIMFAGTLAILFIRDELVISEHRLAVRCPPGQVDCQQKDQIQR